jgi:hypothetical protein
MDSATIPGNPIADGTDELKRPVKCVELVRLDEPDQAIALIGRFVIANGKIDFECSYGASSSYFVHIDKRTKKTDTVDLGLDDLNRCNDCVIRDITDSLQLNFRIIQIVTPAEDDNYTNSFVGLQNGKFTKIFSIDDIRSSGIRLRRMNEWTLTGESSSRDEIVDGVEDNYPVVVDLRTDSVTYPTLDRQYIGYETFATKAFRAYRVIEGRVDSSLVSVKAGAAVRLDTLYRDRGKVRLKIGDSVMVEVKVETAKEKLEHNNAG